MNVVRRELRVAFSKRAQPVWFRIVKWSVLIVLIWKFHASSRFWWILLGVFIAGLPVHFFYRWKTRGWTQPWGGWNDVEAGREERAS